MAQVKLLKIASDGIPLEHTGSADDVTFLSFTVTGGGPVLSGTGLDMNNTAVSEILNATFNDPTTGYINQTAGNLIVDNIMAKERENTMTTAGGIAFPVITDVAGQVDAFRLPALAAVPTASPTNGGSGQLVYDSADNKLFLWTGSLWDDLSTVQSAENLDDSYIAEVSIAARDLVYISSADNVSPAKADTAVKSQVIGFALTTQNATDPITVRKNGLLGGFSSLTAGARYYLSGATAGAIVASPPTASGHTVVQAGYAKNTTTMDIQIASLGRRA